MQTTKVRRLRIPAALVVTVLAAGVGATAVACSGNVDTDGTGGATADAGKEAGKGGAASSSVETVGVSG